VSVDAGPELATLLRLVAPADAPADPWAALSWAPVGAGGRQLLQHAALRARTAAAARLSAIAARGSVEVVRPARGSLRPGWRDHARRRAGSGYVAYRPVAGSRALLEQVLGDAGATVGSGLAVGADGAVRARVVRDGTPGLLRMGLTETAADPSWAAAGLAALRAQGCARVPEALASGRSGEVTWLVEELLPGRRPVRLTPGLVDQVASFVAALPASDGAPGLRDDAAVIAAGAPGSAAAVLRAADAVAASEPARLPRLGHGDLWSGNVLADGDRLTGVIDWDAWSPAAVPGVDLLHLLGTEQRIRTRSALGEVWLRRPWDDPDFIRTARRHWPDWGGDAEARRMVGTAWWLGQLAADMRRSPALAADTRWLARNVDLVAAAL